MFTVPEVVNKLITEPIVELTVVSAARLGTAKAVAINATRKRLTAAVITNCLVELYFALLFIL
jgi:hypothetical protein